MEITKKPSENKAAAPMPTTANKNADSAYLNIVREILAEGELKDNRTGVRALTISGAMFKHDMKNGFPLLTTKQMPFKNIAIELEFFIKGITDKRWLQDRNCHIWDEWANPKIAPYGHDEAAKLKMANERDLGPIYGFQWRHFGAEYFGLDYDYTGIGIDQLGNLIRKLKEDPNDRRMVVSAWNPQQIPLMALPPCHYGFQVTVINNKLNLQWNQRSVDTMIGLPFNIASYALLLHLLAKQANMEEGKLTGSLADVHIYENHIDGAKEQMARDSAMYAPASIATEQFKGIFDWSAEDTKLIGYKSHPKIKFDIAV